MSLPDPPIARERRAIPTGGRRSTDNSAEHHSGRRAMDSAPRRRSTDPQIRRRRQDHRPGKSALGALITVVGAVLFLGYVFNVVGFASSADRFLSSLNASAQSWTDVVVKIVELVYPAIGLIGVGLILFAALLFLYRRIRGAKKTRALAGREVITLEQFRKITEARGIRPRISTQAYQFLLPYYASSMRARLDDRLIEDLHMTAEQVQDLYGNLLRNTDRKKPVGARTNIVSVMDLLNAVQAAKRQSLMDSTSRPVARISTVRRAQTATKDRSKDFTL
ncbi:hypothetical protein [Terriglobus sp. TAA 43]|uniref:hypothetical protein n=1 Tax=Terriglobus sp. TAA 43 TaxID=278961 RepID=UPI000647DFA3|nr:hypothetical protein [Terriglobus sp. TAA 43]